MDLISNLQTTLDVAYTHDTSTKIEVDSVTNFPADGVVRIEDATHWCLQRYDLVDVPNKELETLTDPKAIFESTGASGHEFAIGTTVTLVFTGDYLDELVPGTPLLADGTVPLTANWDAAAFQIRARTFYSDVATGTAPFTIASTTVVPNLNADMVDGHHFADAILAAGTVPLTAAWDAGSWQIRAETFRSDVVTGTAPLVVASTTVVANLNAAFLNGATAAAWVLADGTNPLTANWDAGAFQIRALTFYSDVATGTAPLTVASTTMVGNFNADLLDGHEWIDPFAATDSAIGAIERGTSAETKTATDLTRYAALDDLGRTYTQKEIVAKGPSYRIDGVNDLITMPNDANLNFGTGNMSLNIVVRTPDAFGADWNPAQKYLNGANESSVEYVNGTPRLRMYFYIGGVFFGLMATDVPLSTDTWYVFTFVFTNGVSNALYINGISQTLSQDTTTGGNFDINGSWWLGQRSGTYYKDEVSVFSLFNLALTATEALEYSNGAPVPYKYLGASQTELVIDGDMSNAASWTFTGVPAWSIAAGVASFDDSKEDYFTQAITPTLGKKYRIKFTVSNVGGGTGARLAFTDQTGNPVFESSYAIYANGSYVLEEICGRSGVTGIRIYADNAAGDSFDLDDVSIVQIGCVLQLEQPGIGHNQWIDASTNELHGTVSGALPINLGAQHEEMYVDLTLTGNSSFTLPMGYKITSIIVKETAGSALTGGLDCGLSANGVEIVSAMAVGANATVNCPLVEAGTIGATFTTADDTIYFSDGDDDTNWNGAELEARVQMSRLTVN